jgi:hypothetical protein
LSLTAATWAGGSIGLSAFSGASSSVLSAAIGVDDVASGGVDVACTATCVAKTRATAAAPADTADAMPSVRGVSHLRRRGGGGSAAGEI